MTQGPPRWRLLLVEAVDIAGQETTVPITESLANADIPTMRQTYGIVKHAMIMCLAIETDT